MNMGYFSGKILCFLLLLQTVSGLCFGQTLPAPPDLFIYTDSGSSAIPADGALARLNLGALQNLMPGALVNFRVPDGRSYPLIFGIM